MDQKQRPQIENLIKSLKKNKDAILILGEKVVPNTLKIDDDVRDIYNRKTMVKEPAKFWNWYYENVYNSSNELSEEEKAVNELLKQDIFKMVINLNNTNNISESDSYTTIELRGNKTLLRCMSCNRIFEMSHFSPATIKDCIVKCSCNGKIAPTVIMPGERYKQHHLQEIKKAIFTEIDEKIELNTHTLIFVGVDFEEDYMNDLMNSYNAVKNDMNNDEEYYTVMICEKDGISIDQYKPEFATYEDIAGSITRLIAKIKGE